MQVRRLREDELYHHGVKGQRWGIRRYQNPDGSLTEAGRARYGSVKKLEKEYTKQKNKFYKDIGNGMMAYNHTADKMNKGGYDAINKKYEKDTFDSEFSSKRGQQYIKEIDKAWKKHYNDYVKDVANRYDLLGEDFVKESSAVKVENLFGYNTYEQFIKKN